MVTCEGFQIYPSIVPSQLETKHLLSRGFSPAHTTHISYSSTSRGFYARRITNTHRYEGTPTLIVFGSSLIALAGCQVILGS